MFQYGCETRSVFFLFKFIVWKIDYSHFHDVLSNRFYAQNNKLFFNYLVCFTFCFMAMDKIVLG